MRCWSSAIVVLNGIGRERVDGRLSPGKDVSRTLTVDEAIFADLCIESCNQE